MPVHGELCGCDRYRWKGGGISSMVCILWISSGKRLSALPTCVSKCQRISTTFKNRPFNARAEGASFGTVMYNFLIGKYLSKLLIIDAAAPAPRETQVEHVQR